MITFALILGLVCMVVNILFQCRLYHKLGWTIKEDIPYFMFQGFLGLAFGWSLGVLIHVFYYGVVGG